MFTALDDAGGHARALGGPLVFGARMRAEPSDFVVDEACAVDFDEAGEHVWVRIEKTGLTTPQLADRWARGLGLARGLIGYSGLKDRHAVTRQWLSFPWPVKAPLPAWPDIAGCRVLAAHRHGRKLRRGTHRANHFEIRLRHVGELPAAALAARMAALQGSGIPNYFGPQRFGREGANLDLARALFDGARLRRTARGFALSAARALLFNAVLDARIRAAAWPGPLSGDVFMLDGSHSVFVDDAGAPMHADLGRRVTEFDIHPTGPLPGRLRPGAVQPHAEAGALEAVVLAAQPAFVAGLERAGVDADRRPLRVAAGDLRAELVDGDLLLTFSLPPGAFATSLIRELATVAPA